ncbi:uncharacterized protein Z518_07399 [Rhinocladiella mackenziei CBS 650.93]|uniref:Rhinocladiella mackenziei CBS 650.93 unplaced genomic scaffold supercont1.5, whole genome shotgun sequence n=1 Tax=Rhinocladiella mackenziei CBS 650.93 TaxID=1442369 RepID=A0A0D2IKW7_9EURO|nr:uncharacterized protein Z518_07399 [Rhinocladiella mackenziei CBS 650.93]KIX03846.1 hypothetical protein Z518_07399 [Rhinocladiella mackenziei CBS 650.93]
MANNIIDRVRGRTDTVLVPMNEVGIAFWSSTRHYLATEGLNGCTGVAIISRTAGILAHIAPLPPNTQSNNNNSGHENLVRKMQRVITLYNTYRAHFPEGRSCIVAAVYQNAVALPEAVQTITAVLNRLGLPIKITYYNVLESGTARFPGQTSIVIDANAGGWPKMYVNNQEVRYT